MWKDVSLKVCYFYHGSTTSKSNFEIRKRQDKIRRGKQPTQFLLCPWRHHRYNYAKIVDWMITFLNSKTFPKKVKLSYDSYVKGRGTCLESRPEIVSKFNIKLNITVKIKGNHPTATVHTSRQARSQGRWRHLSPHLEKYTHWNIK